jgi:hypothetical protein
MDPTADKKRRSGDAKYGAPKREQVTGPRMTNDTSAGAVQLSGEFKTLLIGPEVLRSLRYFAVIRANVENVFQSRCFEGGNFQSHGL